MKYIIIYKLKMQNILMACEPFVGLGMSVGNKTQTTTNTQEELKDFRLSVLKIVVISYGILAVTKTIATTRFLIRSR